MTSSGRPWSAGLVQSCWPGSRTVGGVAVERGMKCSSVEPQTVVAGERKGPVVRPATRGRSRGPGGGRSRQSRGYENGCIVAGRRVGDLGIAGWWGLRLLVAGEGDGDLGGGASLFDQLDGLCGLGKWVGPVDDG